MYHLTLILPNDRIQYNTVLNKAKYSILQERGLSFMVLDSRLSNIAGSSNGKTCNRERINAIVIADRRAHRVVNRTRNEERYFPKNLTPHHECINIIPTRNGENSSPKFDFTNNGFGRQPDAIQKIELPLHNEKHHNEKQPNPVNKFFLDLGAKILLYIANGFWPKY